MEIIVYSQLEVNAIMSAVGLEGIMVWYYLLEVNVTLSADGEEGILVWLLLEVNVIMHDGPQQTRVFLSTRC